jgi:hypothetical protein
MRYVGLAALLFEGSEEVVGIVHHVSIRCLGRRARLGDRVQVLRLPLHEPALKRRFKM